MSRTAVIRLVKTLSKSEKRQFRLYTRKHAGPKDYLALFDLIDKNDFTSGEQLEEKFMLSHAGESIDNTARYLLRVLTDCLIQTRVKEDASFQLLYGMLRVYMLRERNLPEESYRELKRLQQMAAAMQDQFISYLFFRHELNHLAAFNFPGLTEKKLVEMQMKARNAIKDTHTAHEHYSLYELLKYRLLHTGKAVSEEEKRQLNDLVLSEMSIVTAKAGNSLESQKLHLLFQSSFFTNIGDYRSALKTFYQLNGLFEKNKMLWQHPPLDYLAALDGILDSLRTIGRYEDMAFYVARLGQLDDTAYPEYFRYLVRKSVMIYQLLILMGTGEQVAAIRYIEGSDAALLKSYSMADEEKQCELYFCAGLAYYHGGHYKKAQQYINEIVLIGKVSHQSVVYRAARLLNILIHYEGGNLDYLDYEIRSFKRAFQYAGARLKLESMLFKTIRTAPSKNTPARNRQLWDKIRPVLESIEKNKYEMQLRKYFDFPGWIRQQLLGRYAPA